MRGSNGNPRLDRLARASNSCETPSRRPLQLHTCGIITPKELAITDKHATDPIANYRHAEELQCDLGCKGVGVSQLLVSPLVCLMLMIAQLANQLPNSHILRQSPRVCQEIR